MRIGLVGLCQVHAVGDGFRHLLEDAQIISIEASAFKRAGKIAQAEALIANCDIVFCHQLPSEFESLATAELRKRFPRLIMIPVIAFTGFHPDSMYFFLGQKQFESPVGRFHSAIVAAAYSLNLSADRADSLFNSFIFRQLGYFDEFAKARQFLKATMQAADLDIEQEWESWMAPGAFMHTINHPKAYVLASIAKMLAANQGLIAPNQPTPDLQHDHLSNVTIWPVYPELARPNGITGNYQFKRAGNLDLLQGNSMLLKRREFIAKCYDLYPGFPPEIFDLPRVSATREIIKSMIRL